MLGWLMRILYMYARATCAWVADDKHVRFTPDFSAGLIDMLHSADLSSW